MTSDVHSVMCQLFAVQGDTKSRRQGAVPGRRMRRFLCPRDVRGQVQANAIWVVDGSTPQHVEWGHGVGHGRRPAASAPARVAPGGARRRVRRGRCSGNIGSALIVEVARNFARRREYVREVPVERGVQSVRE